MRGKIRKTYQEHFGSTKTVLQEKVREALASVLPITAIVLVLCFTISPVPTEVLLAFLVGGAICALGQGILNGYEALGLAWEAAGTATSMTLVVLSALLTGLNLYNKLARYAGAGTLVPITGFANSVVSPAMDFKSEGFITGMAAKMFIIAGPVIVYGTAAAVVYGFLYWLF